MQAIQAGRFGISEYGLSKKAGEELYFDYEKDTGATVYVYRFPNLVGKWVRPNYNSAVGTFCNNIANDLPITVNDPSVELEMLFVDDLLEELYDALEGRLHRCEYPAVGEVVNGVTYDGLTPLWCEDGKYCGATITHKATLSYIVEYLHQFHDQPHTLVMPRTAPDSFEKTLFHVPYIERHK
nr:NAD-dependent epimerase/dehydratase family protein [Succiniclasticum ruminis]